MDEANQSLEESGTPSHEIVVVVLHRGDVASTLSPGLGITLAGGADYETKEITVRLLHLSNPHIVRQSIKKQPNRNVSFARNLGQQQQ